MYIYLSLISSRNIIATELLKIWTWSSKKMEDKILFCQYYNI